jgi:hypothetical protein
MSSSAAPSPAPAAAEASLLPLPLPLPFPPSQLLALVDALSPEELALLRSKLAVSAKSAPASKAAAAKKEAVPAPALPEGEDGDAPDADAYRLPADEIKDDVCNGRRFNETDASKDRRWKPAVYRELQCGAAITEDGLCKTCLSRREKFAANPATKLYLGRVTEEPPEWCAMLGTAWAEERKPVWGAGSAVDAAPPAAVAAAASAASAKKAEKEAAAAAKKAEKEAAAAAKKAEREAAKAAKEAAAAAAKEAKAAAAAAEKAAAKAAKDAAAKKPAAAAAPATATPAVASVPAKADTTPPAAAVAGELMLIMGTTYMVRGKNVYSYDEMSEETGDFCGRLTEDGDGIDTDAEE